MKKKDNLKVKEDYIQKIKLIKNTINIIILRVIHWLMIALMIK